MLGKARHSYNPSTLKTAYPEFQHLVWAERKRRQTADRGHAVKQKSLQQTSATVRAPVNIAHDAKDLFSWKHICLSTTTARA